MEAAAVTAEAAVEVAIAVGAAVEAAAAVVTVVAAEGIDTKEQIAVGFLAHVSEECDGDCFRRILTFLPSQFYFSLSTP